ncbi:MAG: InlB B-repeat-containing protein, partial [Acidimicrobiales bacterium]
MASSRGRKLTALRWTMKRLLIVTVVCALAGLTIAMPADAYFTSNGPGTGSANVATLGSPAPVDASPATTPAGSVVVTWLGVPGPDSQPIDGYFVTENNGTTVSAACGSSPVALLDAGESTGTLSCTDSGLAAGTYVYTVTAVFAPWASAATSGSVIVPGTDTVTFDSEGGAPVTSMSGPDGSPITLPSDTYTNYTFDGWFSAASGGTNVGGAGSSYDIPSGGITLYAQWTALSATDAVTFDSEGGAPVNSMSGPDGSPITLPSDTYTNYTFDGWFTAASGGTNVGGAGSSYDIPSGGITLYAQWTAVVPGTDTVTFDSEGGAPVNSMSGPDGSPITLPSDTYTN